MRVGVVACRIEQQRRPRADRRVMVAARLDQLQHLHFVLVQQLQELRSVPGLGDREPREHVDTQRFLADGAAHPAFQRGGCAVSGVVDEARLAWTAWARLLRAGRQPGLLEVVEDRVDLLRIDLPCGAEPPAQAVRQLVAVAAALDDQRERRAPQRAGGAMTDVCCVDAPHPRTNLTPEMSLFSAVFGSLPRAWT